MNEVNSNPEDEIQKAGPSVGQIIKDARHAAKLDSAKVCNDLRISPSVLEALEEGKYHLLSGDPYIRALLGSIGRYLGLDSQKLIQNYNSQIGAVEAAPMVSPYKDRAHTYTTAHKQIFIAVVLILLAGLIVIVAKLNKHEIDPMQTQPAPNSALPESLSQSTDTGAINPSLMPDSNSTKTPPEGLAAKTQGIPVPSVTGVNPAIPSNPSVSPNPTPAAIATNAAPTTNSTQATDLNPSDKSKKENTAATNITNSTPANLSPTKIAAVVPNAAANAATDSGRQNVATIRPLMDSVGIKVLRTGKEDFLTVLRLGKQMQVSHSDTLIVFISKRKAVEVTLGNKTVIPDRKRFKIYGNTVKPY